MDIHGPSFAPGFIAAGALGIALMALCWCAAAAEADEHAEIVRRRLQEMKNEWDRDGDGLAQWAESRGQGPRKEMH